MQINDMARGMGRTKIEIEFFYLDYKGLICLQEE